MNIKNIDLIHNKRISYWIIKEVFSDNIKLNKKININQMPSF